MSYVVTAATLLAVWYVLSGKLDLLHFGVGVAASLGIAALFSGWRDNTRFRPLRFLRFVPWLAGQIVLSNLRVARLVLTRGMPIRPTFISQPPGVAGDRALTTLASGMTLTPGTLTIDVGPDEIFIHALDRKSAEDARSGAMAARVGTVFTELA
jgi:multicomponent Na+:H+ antiporter subunit E